MTHPAATIDRPPKAETTAEPNEMPTASVLDLHTALDAEAADEAEGGQPQHG
jgi:hypothetical protein